MPTVAKWQGKVDKRFLRGEKAHLSFKRKTRTHLGKIQIGGEALFSPSTWHGGECWLHLRCDFRGIHCHGVGSITSRYTVISILLYTNRLSLSLIHHGPTYGTHRAVQAFHKLQVCVCACVCYYEELTFISCLIFFMLCTSWCSSYEACPMRSRYVFTRHRSQPAPGTTPALACLLCESINS